jgi:hypothetical protein
MGTYQTAATGGVAKLAAAGRTCCPNIVARHLLASDKPMANGWYLREDLESFPDLSGWSRELDWSQAFLDGSFVPAKKGGSGLGSPDEVRAASRC